MEHRFSRQELFDRIWSTPMRRVAAELGTTTGRLSSLLRRAGIPTPPPGHWIKKEFGKALAQPSLPPAPPECPEPLVLDTNAETTRARRPETAALEAEPAAQSLSEVEATSASVASSSPLTSATRPSQPTKLSREELYAAVWETPMSRLADQYGISDNGLAKICRREDIPYPPRGYWAKHAVGKAPERSSLSKNNRASRPITIYPTPRPEPPPDLPVDVRRQIEGIHADASSIAVSERLVKPHAIISAWLTDHEERKRRARQERDPWRKKLYDPGDLSDSDRRRHRFLDALFKAIERQGGKVVQESRRELVANVSGEKIEFQLREKHKQIRRPLTADEQRWRIAGDKDWKQELAPTGRLAFEIRTYLPAGLRGHWLEAEKRPLEDMLPEIVGVFVAAGPLLVQQRREREAAERERRLAERRRYEEQQKRRRDANRWRHFREIALDWRELAAARNLLSMLRSIDVDLSVEINGRSVGDWLVWAEDRLKRADPTANGLEGLFKRIAEITEWSYRD
jgi:hypothetical protein